MVLPCSHQQGNSPPAYESDEPPQPGMPTRDYWGEGGEGEEEGGGGRGRGEGGGGRGEGGGGGGRGRGEGEGGGEDTRNHQASYDTRV